MAETRTFTAVPLPAEHRRELQRIYGDQPGFSWTPPEQLHMTLRFLGDIEDGRLEQVVDALGRIRVAPFFLPLEGIGTFPPRGAAKVIWVGVGRGHPLLSQLRQQLDDTLLRLGLAVELRAFQPHVTLARMRTNAVPMDAVHFVKKHREWVGPNLYVDRFGLYASELGPSGATHRCLHEFTLKAE